MSNLTTIEGVAAYMRRASSEADWNDRCDHVKHANGGNYPLFWFEAVILSGVAAQTQLTWHRSAA